MSPDCDLASLDDWCR